MTAKWYVLMKDELRNIEHIYSFFFIILSIFVTLYFFFTSKTLQLMVLLLFGGIKNTTYYHFIGYHVLLFIFPFVSLILVYDAVYRDLEDERVRLIVTKVSRVSYLISKILSRLVVVIGCLIAILFFVMCFSKYNLGRWYLGNTFTMFVSLTLMSIFISSCYLFISCFSKKPLFASILIPFVSLLLTGFGKLSGFSYYVYMTFESVVLNQLLFFVTGTLIIFMANIFCFNRKRL